MHRLKRRILGLLALGLVALPVAMLVASNLHTAPEPTLPDAADGDRILVDKFAYLLDEERNFIKRLPWPPVGDDK